MSCDILYVDITININNRRQLSIKYYFLEILNTIVSKVILKSYFDRDLVQQSIKIIVEITVNVSSVARIKFSSNLENSRSAIGYYSYTIR